MARKHRSCASSNINAQPASRAGHHLRNDCMDCSLAAIHPVWLRVGQAPRPTDVRLGSNKLWNSVLSPADRLRGSGLVGAATIRNAEQVLEDADHSTFVLLSMSAQQG